MRRRAKKIQRSSARGVATRRRGGVNRNRRGARSGGHTHQAGHQHQYEGGSHSSHYHSLYDHINQHHGGWGAGNFVWTSEGGVNVQHQSTRHTGQAGNMEQVWMPGTGSEAGHYQTQWQTVNLLCNFSC